MIEEKTKIWKDRQQEQHTDRQRNSERQREIDIQRKTDSESGIQTYNRETVKDRKIEIKTERWKRKWQTDRQKKTVKDRARKIVSGMQTDRATVKDKRETYRKRQDSKSGILQTEKQ